MKKLYTAYFYTPDGDKDSDIFVADSKIELDEQFFKYSKLTYGMAIKKDDIDLIVESDWVTDYKGNAYQVTIKKK